MSSLLHTQQTVPSNDVEYSQFLHVGGAPSPGGGLMPPPTGVPPMHPHHPSQLQQHAYHTPFAGSNQVLPQQQQVIHQQHMQQHLLSPMSPAGGHQHQMVHPGYEDNMVNQTQPQQQLPRHVGGLMQPPAQQQIQHVPDHHKSMAPPPPAKRGRRGRPPRAGRPLNHHVTMQSPRGAGAGGNMLGGDGFDDEEDHHTLYGAVKAGRVAVQTLVDDWIEQYKTNRDPAMLELMQFFISCSGCKGKISPEMYSRMTHADMIRRMTEEFDEDSGEYPLINMGKNWRRFRSNFVDFIQLLIRQCQYSIIYDQYMIDQIISLLTGLTDSQVRAFRHTSTLAAMKMMTALVDVALNLSINRDNTQRQYESERQKGQAKRASDRLDLLMNRRQELEENMEEVKNMLVFLFKGVFVHRYRDSIPEIRSICMQEIGVWMRRYPHMFLDDSYLKYVGWTLYDRVGEVRLQCGKALQPLYEVPSLVASLELFTSRFKSRLVDMTLDKEPEVAVQAVKVISCILKHNEQILEDKDCENIYELVYCSHRPLAQAAGEFLSLKLFQVDANAPITKNKKGKKRSENTPLIRDLIQFFIESELHEHAAYLVDSLWESCSMLRDWECMLDLLVEGAGKNEEPFDAMQEDSLIEIMTCCAKQAATGESPVGRQSSAGSRGKQPTQREHRQLTEERARLTEALIPTLPSLLLKYSVDSEKLANLLQLPLFMELDMYTSTRQERPLDLLLKYLQEAVEKHTEPEVLQACAKVFESTCQDDLSISTKCQTVRGALLDSLSERYRHAFLNYFNDQGEEPDSDDEFSLVSALKRIHAFYTCHDLTPLDLWESLMTVCQSAQERPNFSENMVTLGISCGAHALLWSLHRVTEENPDKNDLKVLRRRLTSYLTICAGQLNAYSKRISREAFLSVCDLLVVFSRHITEDFPSLSALIFESDRDLEIGLARFLQKRVFVEDEHEEDENVKIEDLHDRRTHLACFCKLIIYNILPIRCASVVYKNYLRLYNDFGDIMKTTLGKTREINRVHTAKMIARALLEGYSDLEAEQGVAVNRNSEGFQSLKELARRHNLSFGLDLVKIREAMVALQAAGIQACLAVAAADHSAVPSNLAFLEIMAEFSNKLLRQDKQSLLQYLAKVFPTPIGDAWSSLNVYRSSLDPDLAEASSIAGTSTHGGMSTTGTGAPRGRPKRINRDSDVNLSGPPPNSTVGKRRRVNSSNTEGSEGSEHHLHQQPPHHHQPNSQLNMQQVQPSYNEQAKFSSRGRPIRAPNRETLVEPANNGQQPQSQTAMMSPPHHMASSR